MCNDPVHGPALKAVHSDGATPAVSHDVQDLRKAGLGLNACIHTMEGQHVTLKDLWPGFAVAEKGGVVKLAELQAQGYAYPRPWLARVPESRGWRAVICNVRFIPSKRTQVEHRGIVS